MKPELTILAGLAAVATADALPPEEIPIQCVTICGPIVELTAVCDVKRKRARSAARRRRQQADTAAERAAKRSFEVLVPAPTSFPPELLAPSSTRTAATSSLTTATSSLATASITRGVKSSISTRASSSSSSSATRATTTAAPSSTSLSTVASASTSADAHGDGPMQKGKGSAMESAEEQCVCLNESFDVPQVAALCSSCIAMAGYYESNMEIIMSECNFTAQTYSPARDRVVNNVRVQATKPATLGGSNAGVTSGTTTTVRAARLGLVVSLVGIVVGMSMVL